MKATIHEMGNGLPTAGDYCASPDALYRVVSIDSRVQTGGAGSGVASYVYATVDPVEWDECPEGDEFPARVTVDDEPVAAWGRSTCDKCGETATDIDTGFSPGVHEMRHDCGGTWRVGGR